MRDSVDHRLMFDVEYERELENVTKAALLGRTYIDFLDDPELSRELFRDFWNTYFSWTLKEIENFSQQAKQAKYPLKLVKSEGITYPLKNVSSIYPNYEGELPDGLTEQGGLFFKTFQLSMVHKLNKAKEKEERTFRDYVDGSNYRSL